ncbi:hypothetical protein CLG94_05525 [Candidatus Methylomirabilis limnetica]|uniref:Uncharacterized protein n=1 Tax=Candidatus Methylomirabilis limnetica TaxID=2033718 RepID=A0A2T4TYD8_9BACT|nr:hypothetical protein CLG94_05525 [Candidatus Methylomirabilis limnetica]
MTARRLQRDGFIWEVRRKLDESYTWGRGEDQERISINSVCPYYIGIGSDQREHGNLTVFPGDYAPQRL